MDNTDMMDMLPSYYSRVFPAGLMHRWLSYGDDETVFPNREFSFVLPGDVYIRYQSFASEEEFAKQLVRRVPEKIDIGAVFNLKPKLSKGSPDFQPIQKELVLDIDLTDYDDIRTCCSGANVCQKCWKFMVVAVEILDEALRKDFGFEHLLWVFSGRRGIHCWICDEVARFLDAGGRSAVIEYLTIVRGGENQAKKVKCDTTHPSIERAIKIVDDYFEIICIDEQEIFENNQKKNLALLPAEVKNRVLEAEGSRKRWNIVKAYAKEKKSGNLPRSWNKTNKELDELKLQFCYPRLDVNVSKGLNHLLKSPFCVHPKTGRICVPFDPKKIQDFEITKVPTIRSVIEEINEYNAKHSESESNIKIPDWKKTSVAPYMEVFNKFVTNLERSNPNFARKIEAQVALNSELF